MDAGEFLRYLKWIAIALVPLSALWGLLGSKPTKETEDGGKRLTRAGLVTIAVISASALLSALSFHFETRHNEQKKADEQVEKAREALIQVSRDALAKVTKANSDTILWEQRARALQERVEQANARALMVATAVEARERDFAIGRRVGEGAERNLQRTSDALLQLERLQQPLSDLRVTIEWELLPGTPGLARVTEPARRALEAQIAADNAVQGWHTVDGRPPRRVALQLCPGTPLWPAFDRSTDEQRLQRMIFTISASLIFTTRPLTGAELAALRNERIRTQADALPELFLSVPGRPITDSCALHYRQGGSLAFSTSAEIPALSLRDSTAIISYPDLERAPGYLVIEPHNIYPSFRPFVRARSLEISTANRRYSVSTEKLRALKAEPQMVGLLALPPLGDGARR